MDMNLKNRKVVITGVSEGIGKSLAIAFAKAGAKVAGSARNKERLYAIEREISGAGHFFFSADFSKSEDIQMFYDKTISAFGGVDILINNVGVTKDTLLMKMKDEDWDEVINTNLKSVFKLSRSVIRKMMKNRYGRIINISSVVGHTGNAGQTNYTAAKAGMSGFTKSLAQEVGSRGVTVNCVAPGFIDTDMTRSLPDDYKNQLLSKIPLARLGSPKDIANAVTFLASDNASYITGETLHINGGMLMV